MGPLGVVVNQPDVEVGLKRSDQFEELLTGDDVEELLLDRSDEPFDEAVGLG